MTIENKIKAQIEKLKKDSVKYDFISWSNKNGNKVLETTVDRWIDNRNKPTSTNLLLLMEFFEEKEKES